MRHWISDLIFFCMPNFTPEELILFLYGDASQELVQEIEKALQYDWSLQQKLAVLRESHQHLDTVKLQQPRKQAVNAILDYARQSTEVVQ
jgi:hypothetical protein